MVDFTIVNPTKDSFNTGYNINQKFQIGFIGPGNPSVGSGVLQTFVSNDIAASGSYSAFGNSGNFNISVTPDGGNFQVVVQISGSFSQLSRQFVGAASQPGSNTVQLTDITNSGNWIVFTQNNGSWLTDGKIDLNVSGTSVTLYIDANV